MNKVKTSKILIPVDFSKTSLNAIKYAAFMAQFTKGELMLIHVQNKSDLLDIIMPAVNLKDVSVITKYLSDKLEKIAADIKSRYGIKVSTNVSTGHITSEIVALADEYKATLVVMGTHGKDSKNGFFLGSNAYRVLSQAEIPVMTVQTAAEKLGFSTIVLPIDSSRNSRQKVNAAIDFANTFHAKLQVIGLLQKGNEGEKNYEYNMKVILSQIKALADKKNVGCVTTLQFTDSRSKATLNFAKKVKADLIISMTDQSAEFSSIVLGDYIHQLTNYSKIPVLCIPPTLNPDMMRVPMGGLEY
ncbi:MAG: universal stress protein [Bacteroidetes bacterium]|nr:universal stress protein [Bacteroidota bacterium]